MNRRRADRFAFLLVGAVVAVGLLFAWDAFQRRQAVEEMGGGMMGGGMMGSMMVQTPNPLWYVLGTGIVAAVMGGSYLLLRSELASEPAESAPITGGAQRAERAASEGDVAVTESPPSGAEQTPTEASAGSASGGQATVPAETDPAAANGDTGSAQEAQTADGTSQLLQVLPDDERRVLEPVVDSPGITQIALRDRSGFSKSKVSQTVSELEKRGLLYREKQGRTFRVYPDDDLDS